MVQIALLERKVNGGVQELRTEDEIRKEIGLAHNKRQVFTLP